MIREGMTIQQAAAEWKREFSCYPRDMIEDLVQAYPDDWTELTMPTCGDQVCVTTFPDGCEDHELYGQIEKVVGDVYLISLDDGNTVELGAEDFEVQRDGMLPVWGSLWAFKEILDDNWLSEQDGIRKMSECGFRVYEHEEWGYFFGIDGAGYDFMEAHWIPLYKARGLKWHDEEKEGCA